VGLEGRVAEEAGSPTVVVEQQVGDDLTAIEIETAEIGKSLGLLSRWIRLGLERCRVTRRVRGSWKSLLAGMEQDTDALLALVRAVVRSGLVGSTRRLPRCSRGPVLRVCTDQGRRHMRSSIEWRGECVSGKWQTGLLPIKRGEDQGALFAGVVEASSSRLFRTGREGCRRPGLRLSRKKPPVN